MLILGPNSPWRMRIWVRRKRDRTGTGIGEPFRECLVEVVARLSFQLYFLINLKTGQGADATEIVVGLRQAEIVGKNTQFHVVPVLRGSERYQATCQESKKATRFMIRVLLDL
jgi:hypothetical protein